MVGSVGCLNNNAKGTRMKLILCTNNSIGARLLRLLMWSDNSSMTLQGTTNFGHSQGLKASLAAATTVEQINSIVWG